MSLLSSMPLAFRHPFFQSSWWDHDFATPSRIFDQNFGLALRDDDLFPPSMFHGIYIRPRRAFSRQNSGMSEVTNDSQQFKVSLEVNQFQPEELTVKTDGNSVLIEGKHEERSDEDSYVSRCFCRRYYLPRTCKAEDIQSELGSDNILSVTVPKKVVISKPAVERIVPIIRQSRPEPLPSGPSQDPAIDVSPPVERLITVTSKVVPAPPPPPPLTKANSDPIVLPSPSVKEGAAVPIALPPPAAAAAASHERIIPIVTEDSAATPPVKIEALTAAIPTVPEPVPVLPTTIETPSPTVSP